MIRPLRVQTSRSASYACFHCLKWPILRDADIGSKAGTGDS
jgi:hypothetical protein